LLATQFPIYIVVISFLVNIALVWLIFMGSGFLVRVLGRGGIKAVSKVASLLLAAIAVNMILKGLSMIGVIHLPSL
jgi:multiple antibiotic resistance protein